MKQKDGLSYARTWTYPGHMRLDKREFNHSLYSKRQRKEKSRVSQGDSSSSTAIGDDLTSTNIIVRMRVVGDVETFLPVVSSALLNVTSDLCFRI